MAIPIPNTIASIRLCTQRFFSVSGACDQAFGEQWSVESGSFSLALHTRPSLTAPNFFGGGGFFFFFFFSVRLTAEPRGNISSLLSAPTHASHPLLPTSPSRIVHLLH